MLSLPNARRLACLSVLTLSLASFAACTFAAPEPSGPSSKGAKQAGSSAGDDEGDDPNGEAPRAGSTAGRGGGSGGGTQAGASSGATGGPTAQDSASDAPARYPGSKVFLPATTPAPAVVFLHGSEGGTEGTAARYAQQIAQQGFVVLALCWFGCQGTPAKIQGVALDRTLAAATWLKATKEVTGKKLGLFGWSRGAEQAVLLASLVKTTDTFAAVLAHAPSDTVVAGFDPDSQDGELDEIDPATGKTVFAAAWTWNGAKLFGEKGLPWGSGPRIVVEGYPGPMWISHGTRDQLWEVGKSQRIVASRAQVPGLVTEPHYWQGEDHATVTYSQANQTEWMRVLVAFLRAQL